MRAVKTCEIQHINNAILLTHGISLNLTSLASFPFNWPTYKIFIMWNFNVDSCHISRARDMPQIGETVLVMSILNNNQTLVAMNTSVMLARCQ